MLLLPGIGRVLVHDVRVFTSCSLSLGVSFFARPTMPALVLLRQHACWQCWVDPRRRFSLESKKKKKKKIVTAERAAGAGMIDIGCLDFCPFCMAEVPESLPHIFLKYPAWKGARKAHLL